jgi:hypothetical protein
MACDRGSGRAACDKAKVLAVAIASGAAAASALLSMPTERSEPVVAILLASHRFEGESRLFLRRSASRPLVACRAGEGSARNQRGWRSLEAVSLIGIGRPMMVIDLPPARAECSRATPPSFMMVLFGMAVFLQRDWLPEADGLTLPDFSEDAVTEKQQWAAALIRGNGVFWHLDSKDRAACTFCVLCDK